MKKRSSYIWAKNVKQRDGEIKNNSWRTTTWWRWSCFCIPCDSPNAQIVPTSTNRSVNRKTSNLHVRFQSMDNIPRDEFEKDHDFNRNSNPNHNPNIHNTPEKNKHQLTARQDPLILFENDDRTHDYYHENINSHIFPSSSSSADELVDSNIRRKPQSMPTSVTTLEDEIYLFVIDIAVKSNIDINDDRLIFDPSAYPVYFYYSGDPLVYQCISSNFELVAFLRAVAFFIAGQGASAKVRKHSKDKTGDNNKVAEAKIAYLYGSDKQRTVSAAVSAASSLSQLLSNYQDFPKDYTESIDSLQGLWDGNCFCAIEKAIITTDIFIVALIQHLDILMDGDSGSWSESLTSVILALFQSILHLGNFFHVSESTTVKFLWSQLVVRCCRLVMKLTELMKVNRCYALRPGRPLTSTLSQRSLNVGNLFLNRSSIHSPSGPRGMSNANMNGNLRPLSDLVNILQVLNSCINLVKVLSGTASSGYYASIVIYWETCSKVMQLIKMYDCSLTSSNGVTSWTDIDKSAAMNLKPSLLMLHSRSFNSFHMTAPSLQELHYEVNCIAAFKYTLNSSVVDDKKLINILQWYCQRIKSESAGPKAAGVLATIIADVDYLDESHMEESGSVVGESSVFDNNVEGGSSLSLSTATMSIGSIGASGNISLSSPQFTFRMRIIFIGLANLFAVPDMKNMSIASYNIPDKIDWITALAEFLFVILAQVPLGGISNNNTANLNGHFNGVMSSKNSISSYNQKRGNSAGSSSSSWQANANNLQCSPHLISLAPYVASLLLNSIFGSNIPPSIDWIFWGLAKRLGSFTDFLRRHVSTFQSHGIAMSSRRDVTDLPSHRSFSSSSKNFKNSLHNNSTPKKSIQRRSMGTKKRSTHSTTNLLQGNGLSSGKRRGSKSSERKPSLGHDSSNLHISSATNVENSVGPVRQFELGLPKSPGAEVKQFEFSDSTMTKSDESKTLASMPAQSTPLPYAIDDSVDALCIVQNGSKRWYPGKIIKENFDGTFNILFNDGELQKNVNVSDMRRTKKRQQQQNQQQQRQQQVVQQMQPKPVTTDAVSSLAMPPSFVPKPKNFLLLDLHEVQKSISNDKRMMISSPGSILSNGESIPFLSSSSPDISTVDPSRPDAVHESLILSSKKLSRKEGESYEEYADEIEVIYSARIHTDTEIDADTAVVLKSPYLIPHLSDMNRSLDFSLSGDQEVFSLVGKSATIAGTGATPSLSTLVPVLSAGKAFDFIDRDVSDQIKLNVNRVTSAGNTNKLKKKKDSIGGVRGALDSYDVHTSKAVDDSVVTLERRSPMAKNDEHGGSLTVRSITEDHVDRNHSVSQRVGKSADRNRTGKSKGIAQPFAAEPIKATDSLHALVDVEVEDGDSASGFLSNEYTEDEFSIGESESEDEDRIFEIPSVFDSPGGKTLFSTRNNAFTKGKENVIPRMKFEELNTIGSLPHNSSSFSLSGALLSENNNISFHNSSNHNMEDNSQPTQSLLPSIQSYSQFRGNNNPVSVQSNTYSVDSKLSIPFQDGRNLSQQESNGLQHESSLDTGSSTRLFSWSNNGGGSERFTGRTNSEWGTDSPNATFNGKPALTNDAAKGDGNTTNKAHRNFGDLKLQLNLQTSELNFDKLPQYNSFSASNRTSSASSVQDNNNPFGSSQIGQVHTYSASNHSSNSFTNNNKLDAMDPSILNSLLNTFGVATGLLLQRSITDKLFLDYSCCASGEFSSPRSIESMSLYNSSQANVLFNIREFLEVGSYFRKTDLKADSINNSADKPFQPSFKLAELSFHSNAASLRLCKLLNGDFFNNCLREHMDSSGVKIGEGGFGTVFRVSCPESCGRYKQSTILSCFSCHKRRNPQTQLMKGNRKYGMNKSKDTFVRGKNCCCGPSRYKTTSRSFAIKRIPRERSAYDSPLIYDLFNEITSLELLNGNIGVCGLEDYGVSGSEYWLVMESGGMNLLEWRLQLQGEIVAIREKGRDTATGAKLRKNHGNSSKNNTVQLNESTIALLLSLYLDALYIIKSVHAADIAHFDVKCNNFILRDDPRRFASLLQSSHKNGSASGVIFLADFGEAVPHMTVDRSHPLRKRCRGTITIQSPEMLCVSDSLQMSSSTSVAGELGRSNSDGFFEFSNSIAVESARKENRVDRVAVPSVIQEEDKTEINDIQDDNKVNDKIFKIRNGSMSVGSVGSYDDGVSVLSKLTDKLDGNLFSPNMVSDGIGNMKSTEKRFFQQKPLSHIGNTRKLFHIPNKGSDIWSLGCLLVELLTSIQLFNDRAWTDMFVTLCMERFNPIPLDCIFDALSILDIVAIKRIEALISRSLQQDPSDRADMDMLIEETDAILEEYFGDILMFSDVSSSSALTGMENDRSLPNSPPQSALSPLKLSKFPNNSSLLVAQNSGKFSLEPIQTSTTGAGAGSTSMTIGAQQQQQKLNSLFRALRSQQMPVDFQLISLAALGDVYMSFDGPERIIQYFDTVVCLPASCTPNSSQQFDILHRIGAVDEAVQQCDMAAACEGIGHSYLRCKLYPNRYIVWIRVIPSELNNDTAAVVDTARERSRKHREQKEKDKENDDDASELFELFLSKSHKDVSTFALPLSCPGEGETKPQGSKGTGSSNDDSLDKMLSLAEDTVKQIWERMQKQSQIHQQNNQNQNQQTSSCVVIISVDPLPQNSSPYGSTTGAEGSNQDSQRDTHRSQRTLPPSGPNHSQPMIQQVYDRQAMTVAAALGAVCQSFFSTSSSRGLSNSSHNNSGSNSSMSNSFIPLRRLLPCCESQFDPQLFDHIAEVLIKRISPRR